AEQDPAHRAYHALTRAPIAAPAALVSCAGAPVARTRRETIRRCNTARACVSAPGESLAQSLRLFPLGFRLLALFLDPKLYDLANQGVGDGFVERELQVSLLALIGRDRRF